jgi:hypothetical protein
LHGGAAGEDFDTAWSIATGEALQGAQNGWASTFEWSRHEWKAAYRHESNGIRGDFRILEPLTAA